MNVYATRGTCTHHIEFDVKDDNTLTGVRFIGGCTGNTQGIAKLVEGKNIDEVITLLKGINCRAGTSCPDQLALALIKYKENH